MSIENDQIFEFGPFVLDPLAPTLSRDGREIALPPKAFAVLTMLVENAGRLVTKEDILQRVWSDVNVEEQNVVLNIHAVRRALGEDAENSTYIATVPRRGYRFIAPVSRKARTLSLPVTIEVPVSAARELPATTMPPDRPAANSPLDDAYNRGTPSSTWLRSALAEDAWFLLTSCTLYALLYAVTLFIEVAYQFDSYAVSAIRVAPFVFLWVWTTSMTGLIACRVLTSTRRPYSLALAISVFAASGVILYLSIGSILPNAPITKALFQTYPAHGAYLKSCIYFFCLAAIFLVVPYHFVIAARTQLRVGSARQLRMLLSGARLGTAPKGTVFLRVKWLGVMLTIAAMAAVYATAHLMDNLVSTEYTDTFTQLIQWRIALYFSLGVICVLWYSRSLNAIKIASLELDVNSGR